MLCYSSSNFYRCHYFFRSHDTVHLWGQIYFSGSKRYKIFSNVAPELCSFWKLSGGAVKLLIRFFGFLFLASISNLICLYMCFVFFFHSDLAVETPVMCMFEVENLSKGPKRIHKQIHAYINTGSPVGIGQRCPLFDWMKFVGKETLK